jgi:hypothetical protein
MTELISTINEIVKYGLTANLITADRDKFLERNLVKIYGLYLDISFDIDDLEYQDSERIEHYIARQNVESNFKDFGFYKTITGNIEDFNDLSNFGVGDAIDDLTDIISDLLEVKWRIENNSLNNGLGHFELIFKIHTQQHILELLNYLKNKDS